jgi:hypothetical protein
MENFDSSVPTPPTMPHAFPYGNEHVLYTVPYIRSAGTWGATRWMAVATNGAIYFVYCGLDRTMLASRKQRQMEQLTQNKSLAELLSMGSYFFRVGPNHMANVSFKKQWYDRRIIVRNTSEGTISFRLKPEYIAKLQEISQVFTSPAVVGSVESPALIAKETITSGVVTKEEFSEEDVKQENRRKKLLGWVLLVNSLIGIGLTAFLASKGIVDPASTANAVPWVIDILLACALFGKRDVVKIIFVRSVLGLLVWVSVLASKHDWWSAAGQLAFSAYILYHSKVKATVKSFRVASALLAIAVVLFGLAFGQGYMSGKNEAKEFDTELTASAKVIGDNYIQETKYIYADTSELSSEQIQSEYKKLSDLAHAQKPLLEQALTNVNKGLEEYKDTGSQNNLAYLKRLYEAEQQLNNATIDFADYAKTLDFNNLTEEQKSIFSQKGSAVDAAYDAVNAAAKR